METVEWVFRHAGNCLIEVPPLELPTRPIGRRWSPGWRRCGRTPPPTTAGPLAWSKADRGWLPRHLAVGDVLEFGLAAVNATDGTTVEGFELRWYGWVAYSTDLALIVEGPYPHAPAAADGAAATVACGGAAPQCRHRSRLGPRRARRRPRVGTMTVAAARFEVT